jgi:BirA family biotin operon repressor/biotin-[acetyl-CoA-carboxylase] ligase
MDLLHHQLAPVREARALRYFDQAGSTNDLALAWIREGAPAGAVVLTDTQTSGHGRLGREWFAPAGTALLFSYILYLPAALAAQSTMLGALVVAELCQSLGAQEIGIKYPNDVMIGARKVCGVLPEALALPERMGIALGIGLNVRVNFDGTPLADTAISLEHVLGRPLVRAELLDALTHQLDHWREHIPEGAVYRAWHSRLNMLGQTVSIDTGAERLQGVAESVREDGALLLRLPTGEVRTVTAGDLVVMRAG